MHRHINHEFIAMALFSVVAVGAFGQTPSNASLASPTAPAATLRAGDAAIVDGVHIQQAEVDAVIQNSGKPNSPEQRKYVTQELIARQVVLAAAVKANYAAKAEVQQVVEKAREQAEIQLFIKDHLPTNSVTDEAEKRVYDQYVADLGKNEYLTSVILVPDERSARSIIESLQSGVPFDDVEKQHTDKKLYPKEEAFTYPWTALNVPVSAGKTGSLPLTVALAVTGLDVNAYTQTPIRVGEGLAVARLDGMRPTKAPSFQEVKPMIHRKLESDLRLKSFDEFIGPLLKNASIVQ